MSDLAPSKRSEKMIRSISDKDIVSIEYKDKSKPDIVPTLGFRKSN